MVLPRRWYSGHRSSHSRRMHGSKSNGAQSTSDRTCRRAMESGIDADKETCMSVQAGIWNFDGNPVDRRLLANLSDALKQLGPDGESCYVEGSIGVLYRPLHTTP